MKYLNCYVITGSISLPSKQEKTWNVCAFNDRERAAEKLKTLNSRYSSAIEDIGGLEHAYFDDGNKERIKNSMLPLDKRFELG
jgi:hypothetical protein